MQVQEVSSFTTTGFIDSLPTAIIKTDKLPKATVPLDA